MDGKPIAGHPPGWSNSPRSLRLGLPLITLAVSLLLYARMPFAGFVWDDTLVQRRQLHLFRTVGDAFSPPPQSFELFRSFYRPLVTLSYMLDRAVAGTRTAAAAAWAHGVNVLCHGLATALVYFLALRLFAGHAGASRGAFAAALLFAAHPIHAESVCFIAGRSDLFATVFVLLAAHCALSARDTPRRRLPLAALAGACFFLGMMSKEVSLAALVVIPALLRWAPAEGEGAGPRGRAAATALMGALMAAGVAAYFGLRAMAGIPSGGWASLEVPQLAGRVISAFGYYLGKLVIPWPQAHYVPTLSWSWAALPAAASLAAAAWWAGRKDASSRAVALLSLLWLVAAVLPSLAVALSTLSVTPVAERYLYLPSVGFALLVGLLALHADLGRAAHQAGALAGTALLASFAVSVVERTGVWQGDLEFWTDAVRNPAAAASPLALSNLAEALQVAGREEEARQWYRRAYDLFTEPVDRMKIMTNLALMEKRGGQKSLEAGRATEALAHFERGIGYLEPVFNSPLYLDGLPNALMGSMLLMRHKALQELGTPGDARLLDRASRHLEIARSTRRDDPGVASDLEELGRLRGVAQ